MEHKLLQGIKKLLYSYFPPVGYEDAELKMSPPFTDLVDSQEWEQVKKPSNLMASNMRFFTVHSQHQKIASQVPKYNNYFFWGMLLKAIDASSQDYRLCPYKGLKREERHQVVRPSDYSLTAPFCRICRFIIF